jgi:hypothetical protein
MASARAMATRCCWPPESWRWIGVELVGEADAGEQIAASANACSRGSRAPNRRLDDVLERGQMREQVEALEDHADIDAALQDLALLELVERVAILAVADQLAVDGDEAFVDAFEMIDRAQQGRLARAGLADDRGDAARPQRQADIVEHLERAEALRDVADADLAAAAPQARQRGDRRGGPARLG